MKVDISIIIPTRNRVQSLIDTINSFCNGEFLPAQIVVVDQSDEKYKKQVEKELDKYYETEITYYYLEKPSLTKARNIGQNLAKYDIIICSDDDILVGTDTIKNIYKIFDHEKDIALIAGIDTRQDGLKSNKVQSILGYLFARKNYFKRSGHVTKAIFGTYPRKIDERIETEWAMGYFFALRKNLIRESNILWDEKLISYAYPEDLDFTYRLYKYVKSIGMKMIIDPSVRVEHCVSKEWRITSMQSTNMYVINRAYLSYKLYPDDTSSRILTTWSNIGEFLRRIMIKDKPLDVIKAQRLCKKYKQEIRKGKFPY